MIPAPYSDDLFVHILQHSVAEASFFLDVCESTVERYVKPEPVGRSYSSISFARREDLIVFVYQIWKPQVLSVVQFLLNNCNSPFSLTTFFEISAYISGLRQAPGLRAMRPSTWRWVDGRQ